MEINRIFSVNWQSDKSFFLLGPRQTGKTHLLHALSADLPKESLLSYSLLDSQLFMRLAKNPSLIRAEINEHTKYIFIDEIQLLPILLNELQLLMSQKKLLVIMTGSSARKLKRKGTNLLGGRASSRYLGPLVSYELGSQFDLSRSLDIGMLPSIYLSNNPRRELQDYIGLYLTEEISNERATRNVPAFSRFLEQAAIRNGEVINFTNVANDSQIAPSTVRDYYSILEDTLIARELPVWKKSKSYKASSSSKYYFFDIGVARAIADRKGLSVNTKEYGDALEALIYQELWGYGQYKFDSDFILQFWRSQSKLEVDFLFNESIAIEVKSTKVVSDTHLKGLKALMTERKQKRYILVCHEPIYRKTKDGIEVYPIDMFLRDLWADKITAGE